MFEFHVVSVRVTFCAYILKILIYDSKKYYKKKEKEKKEKKKRDNQQHKSRAINSFRLTDKTVLLMFYYVVKPCHKKNK